MPDRGLGPDTTRVRWGREIVLAFGAFVVAAVVLTLPVAIHPGRTLPSDLVDTLLNAWIVGWDAERLRHALHGVWDAPIFFPYRDTLAFSENLFGVAIFVAPVYWATGNAVLAYNVAFVLSFAVSGVGMYLLARSLTGSVAAAAIAGAAYAFSPFRFAQIAHVQMVATGWIPVTLWGLHHYFTTRRRGWLAVFATGYVLQAVSSSYVAYYLAVPVAIVAAAGIWRARGRRLRATVDCAIAGVAVLIVLAPVGAAYYRVRHTYGLVRSEQEIASGGADVRSYLVSKNTVGLGRFLPTAVTTDPEKELFPGFVAALLAAVGVIGARRLGARSRDVWLYALVAIAGFVVSLGPVVRVWQRPITTHGPYWLLLHLVPGMYGMRVPARFAIVFIVGLAVLAGFGALVLISRLGTRAAALTTIIVLAAIVADGWTVPLPIERYPGRGRAEDRGIAEWLRGRPAGAVLHLPVLVFEELNWQYATLMHGQPLVNGFSGYETPLHALLRNPRSPIGDYARFPAVVRMLRALAVRHVVVHQAEETGVQQAALEPERVVQGLRASGQVVAEARVLNQHAFELTPWSEAAAPATSPIASSEFTVSVSNDDDRRAYLTDGDLDSRWIGRQEGASWIAARFDRPQDIATVTLRLAARSIEEYPREIQIDSTDSQGGSRTLYRDSPYPEFIRGFVANPEYPAITIRLPPNETMRLAIRETAVYPDRWWSVHELQLSRRVTGAR